MPFITTFGSKQYLVDYKQKFAVDRLKSVKPGDVIDLPILYSFGNAKNKKVKATVLGNAKNKKVRVVKYKNKNNYHKVSGFRSYETVLEVESGEKEKATSKKEVKTTDKKKSITKPVTKKTTTKNAK